MEKKKGDSIIPYYILSQDYLNLPELAEEIYYLAACDSFSTGCWYHTDIRDYIMLYIQFIALDLDFLGNEILKGENKAMFKRITEFTSIWAIVVM